jgi:hypothetical protein
MRSAAFSAIPPIAYTAMMLIAVLTFIASHANAQQRETTTKGNTNLRLKGRQLQATATTWTKADLQIIRQPIAAQMASDSLIVIPSFQPVLHRAERWTCGAAGILIIQQSDPWKSVSPLSVLDFL